MAVIFKIMAVILKITAVTLEKKGNGRYNFCSKKNFKPRRTAMAANCDAMDRYYVFLRLTAVAARAVIFIHAC